MGRREIPSTNEVTHLGRRQHDEELSDGNTCDRCRCRGAAVLDVADLSKRHLAEISGGQRQRAFSAPGLAQEAGVLLLDEPVAGLDVVSIHEIRRIILEERGLRSAGAALPSVTGEEGRGCLIA
ncbi:ATP-binding cassette domain-containing protein [Ilumatobacter sp.]|uniref:ATP-binding cassette domain-containing protein n=1 Tax=Ilumatobacter sp. TaxID=1967498 RepID=UPI003753121D